jgi:phosphoribosylglycinamide formyltransferase-1
MYQIALFCSGGGSNAAKIMAYFVTHPNIRVALMVVNKPNIGALDYAHDYGIPTILTNKSSFSQTTELLATLADHQITHIVLAGWLWLVPTYLLEAYPDRVINIHPALLPKYGGKGMYGHHVHEAVHQNQETESGPTIHLANAEFDKGKILFVARCRLNSSDSPATIAAKVLALEHEYYTPVIEAWILNQPMPHLLPETV